jgi:hypothetical protein
LWGSGIFQLNLLTITPFINIERKVITESIVGEMIRKWTGTKGHQLPPTGCWPCIFPTLLCIHFPHLYNQEIALNLGGRVYWLTSDWPFCVCVSTDFSGERFHCFYSIVKATWDTEHFSCFYGSS